jgi:hypothetical protein
MGYFDRGSVTPMTVMLLLSEHCVSGGGISTLKMCINSIGAWGE